MNLFLPYFGGRRPTRWGSRAKGPRVQGRETRIEEHNHPIKSTQKQKTLCKTCCKLKKHSVYIKLGLTLQSLTTLKFGELLLTANSPKFGFRYNSDKP